MSEHTSIVYNHRFDHTGDYLASASYDGTAKVWDLATGKELFTLAGHTVSQHSIVVD